MNHETEKTYRYSRISETGIYLIFVMIILGYFYEQPILGMSSAVWFLYVTFALFLLVFLHSVRKIQLSLSFVINDVNILP